MHDILEQCSETEVPSTETATSQSRRTFLRTTATAGVVATGLTAFAGQAAAVNVIVDASGLFTDEAVSLYIHDINVEGVREPSVSVRTPTGVNVVLDFGTVEGRGGNPVQVRFADVEAPTKLIEGFEGERVTVDVTVDLVTERRGEITIRGSDTVEVPE